MKFKTKWITQTAVLTALLLVLQFSTKPLGQIVTGSCVNAVLAISALVAGIGTGLTVAILSPLFAFILGIGPQLFPLTPAIAAGNCALVIVIYIICKKALSPAHRIIACVSASVAKFLVLNVLIVQILCRVLELSDKQIAMFSTMFSWPQLITALIGSGIALIIVPRLKAIVK